MTLKMLWVTQIMKIELKKKINCDTFSLVQICIDNFYSKFPHNPQTTLVSNSNDNLNKKSVSQRLTGVKYPKLSVLQENSSNV